MWRVKQLRRQFSIRATASPHLSNYGAAAARPSPIASIYSCSQRSLTPLSASALLSCGLRRSFASIVHQHTASTADERIARRNTSASKIGKVARPPRTRSANTPSSSQSIDFLSDTASMAPAARAQQQQQQQTRRKRTEVEKQSESDIRASITESIHHHMASLAEIHASVERLVPLNSDLRRPEEYIHKPAWRALQREADHVLTELYQCLSTTVSTGPDRYFTPTMSLYEFHAVFHRIHQQRLYHHAWNFYEMLKRRNPERWTPQRTSQPTVEEAINSAAEIENTIDMESSVPEQVNDEARGKETTREFSTSPLASSTSLSTTTAAPATTTVSSSSSVVIPYYLNARYLGLIMTCISASPTEGPEVAAAELNLIRLELNTPLPSIASDSIIRVPFDLTAGVYNPVLNGFIQRYKKQDILEQQKIKAANQRQRINNQRKSSMSHGELRQAVQHSAAAATSHMEIPRNNHLAKAMPAIRDFFHSIPTKDEVSYNTLISAEIDSAQFDKAFSLLESLLQHSTHHRLDGDSSRNDNILAAAPKTTGTFLKPDIPSSNLAITLSPYFFSILLKKLQELLVQLSTRVREMQRTVERQVKFTKQQRNDVAQQRSKSLDSQLNDLQKLQSSILQVCENYWSSFLQATKPQSVLDPAVTCTMMGIYHAADLNLARMLGVMEEALRCEEKSLEQWLVQQGISDAQGTSEVFRKKQEELLEFKKVMKQVSTDKFRLDESLTVPPLFVNPACLNQLFVSLCLSPATQASEYIAAVQTHWDAMQQRARDAQRHLDSAVSMFMESEMRLPEDERSNIPILSQPMLLPLVKTVKQLRVPDRVVANYFRFLCHTNQFGLLFDVWTHGVSLEQKSGNQALYLVLLELCAKTGDFATAERLMSEYEEGARDKEEKKKHLNRLNKINDRFHQLNQQQQWQQQQEQIKQQQKLEQEQHVQQQLLKSSQHPSTAAEPKPPMTVAEFLGVVPIASSVAKSAPSSSVGAPAAASAGISNPVEPTGDSTLNSAAAVEPLSSSEAPPFMSTSSLKSFVAPTTSLHIWSRPLMHAWLNCYEASGELDRAKRTVWTELSSRFGVGKNEDTYGIMLRIAQSAFIRSKEHRGAAAEFIRDLLHEMHEAQIKLLEHQWNELLEQTENDNDESHADAFGIEVSSDSIASPFRLLWRRLSWRASLQQEMSKHEWRMLDRIVWKVTHGANATHQSSRSSLAPADAVPPAQASRFAQTDTEKPLPVAPRSFHPIKSNSRARH